MSSTYTEEAPVLFVAGLDSYHRLHGTVTVGRAADNSLVLPDPAVSRYHLRLTTRDGNWEVACLSPARINGQPAPACAALAHGDELAIGTSILRFLTQGEAGQPFASQRTVCVSLASALEGTTAADTRCHRTVQLPSGTIIIGRDPGDGGLALPSPVVTRRHAELQFDGAQAVVRDLGSTNGTYVNGRRLTTATVLPEGGRLDIGPYCWWLRRGRLEAEPRDGNLAIEADAVTKAVSVPGGRKTILHGINLVIPPNEFVCILGPSGSGKTTLFNAISGRDLGYSGRVCYNREDLRANFELLKPGIGFVAQQNLLHEELTLASALDYTASLRLPADSTAADRTEEVRRVLRETGLEEHAQTPIRSLSGGQKRRACLANEILNRPPVLFLDEVTSGLDEGADWEMMRLFRQQADSGRTVLCITHTVANVEEFCHRVIVLALGGHLAFAGTPAEAKAHFQVRSLSEIYRRLAEQTGQHWGDRFIASSPVPPPQASPTDSTPCLNRPRFRFDNRQTAILARRAAACLLADRGSLLTALAQSVVVSLLLSIVFGHLALRDQRQVPLLFFLGISCLWFGCNHASKEIAKERALYRRERDVNLAIPSYVAAKFAVSAALSGVQAALLFLLAGRWCGAGGNETWQLGIMIAAAWTGTAGGLLISAVARSVDQANAAVPMALIPQILLANVIVNPLPAIANVLAQAGVSGFWVFRALQGNLLEQPDSASRALIYLGAHTLAYLALACWWLGREVEQDRRPLPLMR